jgi:hypothetical protein
MRHMAIILRNVNKLRLAWSISALLGIASTLPAAPTFRKVADMTTAIPNGSGNFTSFADFGSGAPVIDAGAVAFYATGASGQEGVYLK